MVLTLADVPVLDRNAEALGVSVQTLMENAGRAVAARVAEAVDHGTIVVLAGPGNNGGDGLVAARHLATQGARYRVRVVTPVGNGLFKTEATRHAFAQLPPAVEVRIATAEADVRAALAQPCVIVDALLGAGIAGAPREPFASYVRAANASRHRVIAVDVPSGFGTPLAIRPDETVTFHDVKAGMTRENSGHVHVADIGIPDAAARFTGPGEFALYPRPKPEQHKGEGGITLVIGGGPYTGAPAIAGLAALRAGADLAIVLTPKRAWGIIAQYSPNLVVRPLNGDDLDFDDPANRVTLNLWLKKAKSVVIGPGLGLFGNAPKSARFAIQQATKEGLPVVVDADALTALGERKDLLAPNVVVTPHAREFRALTGEELPKDVDKRAEAARLAAAPSRATFLVKGPVDVVSDGERVKLNATGHPAMSVGGTGDALAGIVGALLAKGLPPFDAARLGAYLCGRAGEAAAAEKSLGLVATDVVEAIPYVLRDGLAQPSR